MSVCRKLFHEFPLLKEVYESGSFTKMGDVKFSGKLRIIDRLLLVMRQAKDKVLLFSTSVQVCFMLVLSYIGGHIENTEGGGVLSIFVVRGCAIFQGIIFAYFF